MKELYPKSSYDTAKNYENFHYDDLLIIQTERQIWSRVPGEPFKNIPSDFELKGIDSRENFDLKILYFIRTGPRGSD